MKGYKISAKGSKDMQQRQPLPSNCKETHMKTKLHFSYIYMYRGYSAPECSLVQSLWAPWAQVSWGVGDKGGSAELGGEEKMSLQSECKVNKQINKIKEFSKERSRADMGSGCLSFREGQWMPRAEVLHAVQNPAVEMLLAHGFQIVNAFHVLILFFCRHLYLCSMLDLVKFTNEIPNSGVATAWCTANRHYRWTEETYFILYLGSHGWGPIARDRSI